MTNKLNIVFITGGLGLGGSERQLFLVASGLQRLGHTCHIILLNPDQNFFSERLARSGVQLWPLAKNQQGVMSRLRAVFTLLRQIRPTIVHSWIFHDNPYAGIAGWLARVPVRLGSQRNIYASIRRLPALYRWLALHTVSQVVVNSQQARRELAARLPAQRLILLPNCVEIPAEQPASDLHDELSALGVPPGATLIGMVGNLRRQKNHLLFVEAMARLLPHFPEVHALIIGRSVWTEPGIREEIESAIATAGISGRITLTGPHHDAAGLMGHLSLFCLTSDYEGRPNVILEAMAAGLPVVATAVGGVPELIEDGVTGLLTPPGQAAPLVDALTTLLNDPARRKALGSAARTAVSTRYNCQDTVQYLADQYHHLLTPKN